MAGRTRRISKVVLSVFLITSIIAGACAPATPQGTAPTPKQQPTSNQTIPSPDVQRNAPTPPVEPSPPYTLELSFPNGAPALNQVAELEVVVVHKTAVMDDVRINVILPEGFELVSGNLTWSADTLPQGETEVINAYIKSRKIGKWTIEARLIAAKSNLGFPEGGARHPIYVLVQESFAEWGIYPPWYKGGGVAVPIQPAKYPPYTDNTTR